MYCAAQLVRSSDIGGLPLGRLSILQVHCRCKRPSPEGVLVWHTVNVGRLVKLIDKAVEKSRRKKS